MKKMNADEEGGQIPEGRFQKADSRGQIVRRAASPFDLLIWNLESHLWNRPLAFSPHFSSAFIFFICG
jgi:hypothetical protein